MILEATNNLAAFQTESNWIEGISGFRDEEVAALRAFVEKDFIVVGDLVAYVGVVQPDARARFEKSIPGVRVGNHVAPPSGVEVLNELQDILFDVIRGEDRSLIHKRYETLHPFTDGNGRSGRALWLWQFARRRGWVPDSFLRFWYYDSLQEFEG